MWKKTAGVVKVSGVLLIIGTLGMTDMSTNASKLYELTITLRLIAGGAMTVFGQVWSNYLEELERIRRTRSIKSRRCIEEIKMHPGRETSGRTNKQSITV